MLLMLSFERAEPNSCWKFVRNLSLLVDLNGLQSLLGPKKKTESLSDFSQLRTIHSSNVRKDTNSKPNETLHRLRCGI